MTEDEPKKKMVRRPILTVLVYAGITIKKDINSYRVTGGKKRELYYRTLPDALFEMRNRLLDDKLHIRHDSGLADIASLVQVLKEQHREMMQVMKDFKEIKGDKKDDKATCDG